MENASRLITEGKAVLGIELGSTRIRAVLIDRQGNILETGGHNWENHLVEGICIMVP
jgi:sugar (pentulose or hexulose) kinase